MSQAKRNEQERERKKKTWLNKGSRSSHNKNEGKKNRCCWKRQKKRKTKLKKITSENERKKKGEKI